MNDKVGFLIGAGASYELGLPLVDELTIEFKKSVLKLWDAPYYLLPKEISNIIHPLLKTKSMHYEDIIGRIEVEIDRNRDRKLHQEWNAVLHRYLEIVFVLILERHKINEKYIEKRLKLFEPISKYCKKNPLWVFSLNHDCLVEIMANKFRIPIQFGFKEKVTIAGCEFEELSRENMEKNQFSFIHNGEGINLVKIHGALDIFVQGDDKNYLKVSSENKDKTIDEIYKLLANDVVVKKGVKCTNEITYYDQSNVLQFLRMTIMSGKHKYSSRMSHNMDDWFFKVFKGHINYVENLYCIGISFQDPHVNTVLYEWLRFSKNRKIYIVNPHFHELPSMFTHIEGQVEIINKGFLDFLNQENLSITTKFKIKVNNMLRGFSRRLLLNTNITNS